MTWFGVLFYIIRQIKGTSFPEDDFRPTKLAIILSSWSRISHQFASYGCISQSTFSSYNGHLLAVCLHITITNKTISGGHGNPQSSYTKPWHTSISIRLVYIRWFEREREGERGGDSTFEEIWIWPAPRSKFVTVGMYIYNYTKSRCIYLCAEIWISI